MQMFMLELDILFPDARSTAGSAWISLRQHPQEERGFLHITNHCATFGELELQINQIQKELEEIKKLARKKFAENKVIRLK